MKLHIRDVSKTYSNGVQALSGGADLRHSRPGSFPRFKWRI
ncbi:MAG TPA: hypothetical protein VGB76_21870 [Pyrinomonadaceae bacterium]